jgi:hypothetical protein
MKEADVQSPLPPSWDDDERKHPISRDDDEQKILSSGVDDLQKLHLHAAVPPAGGVADFQAQRMKEADVQSLLLPSWADDEQNLLLLLHAAEPPAANFSSLERSSVPS